MEEKMESEQSYSGESSSSSESCSGSGSGSSEPDEELTEPVRLLGQSLELPQELCENYGLFKEFFSYKTWETLEDTHKEQLKKYLPKFVQNEEEEQEKTIKMLFDHEPFHFTSPLEVFYSNLKQGNYRPDIAKMRKFLQKARTKQQKHKIKSYYAKLMPEVLISRERLLAAAKSAPPGPTPRLPLLPPKNSSKNTYKPLYLRARQRYFEELAAIQSEVGGDESEDDNYPEGPPEPSHKKRKHMHASQNQDSNVSGTLGGTESSHPTSLDCLKNVLAAHRARRQYRENHPELNTSGLTLEDIKQRVALVNGTKKLMFGGQKSETPAQKVKRGPKKEPNQRQVKADAKATKRKEEDVEHKPLLPNIKIKCEQEESDSESSFAEPKGAKHTKKLGDNVEIKQEVVDPKYSDATNLSYIDPKLESVIKQEPLDPTLAIQNAGRIIQPVPIKLEDLDGIASINDISITDMMALPVELADDDLPDTSNETVEPVDTDEALTETTHANFLSLVRALFPARAAHRASKQQLHARCTAVMRSPIAPLNTWYSLSEDWCAELDSALDFLAGERGPHPNDFVPYLQYIPETQMYQWIGAGRDCDAILGRLCERWFRAASPAPPANEPPPPRYPTSWVVRPLTSAEVADFRAQERKRYASAAKPFTYIQHGYRAVVGPCARCGGGGGAGGALLAASRPRHASLLALVRDAVARLPNGEGTRHDVLTLLKMSQWISACSDQALLSALSTALDRLLSAKRDPVVKYDQRTAIWTYLHRNRTEEDWLKSTARGRRAAEKREPEPLTPPPAMELEVGTEASPSVSDSDVDVDVEGGAGPGSAQLLAAARPGPAPGPGLAPAPAPAPASALAPAPAKPRPRARPRPKQKPKPEPQVRTTPAQAKPTVPPPKPSPQPKPTPKAALMAQSAKQASLVAQAVKSNLIAQAAKQANLSQQKPAPAAKPVNVVKVQKPPQPVSQPAKPATKPPPSPKPVAKPAPVPKPPTPKPAAALPKSSPSAVPQQAPLVRQRTLLVEAPQSVSCRDYKPAPVPKPPTPKPPTPKPAAALPKSSPSAVPQQAPLVRQRTLLVEAPQSVSCRDYKPAPVPKPPTPKPAAALPKSSPSAVPQQAPLVRQRTLLVEAPQSVSCRDYKPAPVPKPPTPKPPTPKPAAALPKSSPSAVPQQAPLVRQRTLLVEAPQSVSCRDYKPAPVPKPPTPKPAAALPKSSPSAVPQQAPLVRQRTLLVEAPQSVSCRDYKPAPVPKPPTPKPPTPKPAAALPKSSPSAVPQQAPLVRQRTLLVEAPQSVSCRDYKPAPVPKPPTPKPPTPKPAAALPKSSPSAVPQQAPLVRQRTLLVEAPQSVSCRDYKPAPVPKPPTPKPPTPKPAAALPKSSPSAVPQQAPLVRQRTLLVEAPQSVSCRDYKPAPVPKPPTPKPPTPKPAAALPKSSPSVVPQQAPLVRQRTLLVEAPQSVSCRDYKPAPVPKPPTPKPPTPKPAAALPKSSPSAVPQQAPLVRQRTLLVEAPQSIAAPVVTSQPTTPVVSIVQPVSTITLHPAPNKQVTQGTRSLLIRPPAVQTTVTAVVSTPISQAGGARRGVVRVLSPAAGAAGKSLISPRALLHQATPTTTKKRTSVPNTTSITTIAQTSPVTTVAHSSTPATSTATRTVQLAGGRTLQLAANQTVHLPTGQPVQLATRALQLTSLLPARAPKPVPASTVQLTGQTVHLAGQSVQLAQHAVKTVQMAAPGVLPTQTVQLPSGQTVQLAGRNLQTVQIAGQNVLSGQSVQLGSQTVQLAGQTLQLPSGQTVQLSGQTLQLPSGQTVQLSGQTLQLASGQTVQLASQTPKSMAQVVRGQTAGDKSTQPIRAKLLTNAQGQMISLESMVGARMVAPRARGAAVRVLAPAPRLARPLLLTAAKPLHNIILQQSDGSTIRVTSSGTAGSSQTIVLSNIGSQAVTTSTPSAPLLKLQQVNPIQQVKLPQGIKIQQAGVNATVATSTAVNAVRSVLMDGQQLKLVGGRHVLARLLRPAHPPQ